MIKRPFWYDPVWYDPVRVPPKYVWHSNRAQTSSFRSPRLSNNCCHGRLFGCKHVLNKTCSNNFKQFNTSSCKQKHIICPLGLKATITFWNSGLKYTIKFAPSFRSRPEQPLNSANFNGRRQHRQRFGDHLLLLSCLLTHYYFYYIILLMIVISNCNVPFIFLHVASHK